MSDQPTPDTIARLMPRTPAYLVVAARETETTQMNSIVHDYVAATLNVRRATRKSALCKLEREHMTKSVRVTHSFIDRGSPRSFAGTSTGRLNDGF